MDKDFIQNFRNVVSTQRQVLSKLDEFKLYDSVLRRIQSKFYDWSIFYSSYENISFQLRINEVIDDIVIKKFQFIINNFILQLNNNFYIGDKFLFELQEISSVYSINNLYDQDTLQVIIKITVKNK